ncbi:alpha/beta fold hydrolase [Nakamurella endophytica]|uniref:Hydrolase n=1 Tax=Nakamurella endophytica TaxID=1748367 RepID=A0A917TCR7_9ACTN|nr:alpha/beta hydrolase [Nakamurella endophytica]GGM17877.1 hydrolase [Nakamurella endophytica]
MSPTLPVYRRVVHDELTRLSDAPLSDRALPEPLPLDAPPPDGWYERVDGRGLFVRRTTPPLGAAAPSDQAWYVHGLAGSTTNWTQLADLLADRAVGYSVDLPGHGRSDPPPHGRYRLSDDADLVAAVIRRRSDRPVHLVGNSLGGMVAVGIAARHPDLVRSLTLISPAVPDLRMTTDRGADRRLALLLLPGTTGVAVRRLSAVDPAERARGMAAVCFGDPSVITEDQFRAAAEDLAWRTGLPWVHRSLLGSLRALMTSYLSRGSSSFRAAAARISIPTLVVWGTRDQLVDPRLAERTAAAFPDASLLLLPGLGHTAMMEDPTTTARAVLALWDGVEHAGTHGRRPPGRSDLPGAPEQAPGTVVATS